MFLDFPAMDHLYIRLAWSYLEPEEGVFNLKIIDDIIAEYVPLGYGISFRITTRDVDTASDINGQEKNGIQYATPVWVEEAGCKGAVTEFQGVKSWGPVWDDLVFLEKLDNFHRVFAEKYDGKPWVRYIDVGSIGEWGEGHTSFTTGIPPTVKEIKAHIDLFLKHYKKTLLVVGDDLLYFGKPEAEIKELYDYAVSNGMTVRDDSPLVKYYIDWYFTAGSISKPEFYNPLFESRPIILEMQHYNLLKEANLWIGKNGEGIIPDYEMSGADILLKAVEVMHPTYIGFHGYIEEWFPENPDLAKKLANKCGYWYFPVKISMNKSICNGENKLSITWLNKGLAPAYQLYDLIVKLKNRKTGTEIRLNAGDSQNRKWLPNKEYEESYTYTVSDSIAKGKYSLSFQLVYDSIAIDLGLKTEIIDEDRSVYAGNVTVK
jgi:hypothetical protein